MNITIISACRNEVAHMQEFLDSIATQQLPCIEWEVIVADGLSTDGTRQLLDKYCEEHPRFRVIDNPCLLYTSDAADE